MIFTPLVYPVSVTCNLLCEYCFHRQKCQTNLKQRMSPETFTVFLRELIKTFPEREEFEIVWHGGEPLMRGLEFYQRAIKNIADIAGSCQKIVHCLQTNGTLVNRRWADFFKQNDFRVGVSIDGPSYIHNRFRRYRNGRGTFVDVMKGVDVLRRAEIEFGMVTVVSTANINQPEEVFAFARELGVKKLQISPCVEEGKGEAPFSISSEDFGKFMCRLYDLWIKEDDPDMSVGYLEDIVSVLLGQGCDNCILGDYCHNFMVVDWNGELRPCEDLLGQQVVFGNIKNTSLREVLNSGMRLEFYNRISQRKKEVCGGCEWFEVCGGGCPYQWISFEKGKTALCLANKMMFEHISNSIETLYS